MNGVDHGPGEDEDEDIVAPAPKRVRTNGFHPEEGPKEPSPSTAPQVDQPTQLSGSQRTDHFKFTSSPAVPDGETKERQAERKKLHQQFVRKLGGADCLVGIGRSGVNEVLAEDFGEGDDDEEPAPALPAKGKTTTKKGGSKLTPMEKQVIEIKRQHLDTLLVVEVGYKFRFFGEDARVAAKELGIVCIPGKFRFDERAYTSIDLVGLYLRC